MKTWKTLYAGTITYLSIFDYLLIDDRTKRHESSNYDIADYSYLEQLKFPQMPHPQIDEWSQPSQLGC